MKKITKILKTESRKLTSLFSLSTFLFLTIIGNFVLILTTVIVYFIEKDQGGQINTYFDALWWGVSTVTTIGYGDVLPQTFWGRVIGIGLMYTGTVLFISFTGVLLATLMREEVEGEIEPLKREIHLEEQAQRKIEKSLDEIVKRLDRLEKKDP